MTNDETHGTYSLRSTLAQSLAALGFCVYAINVGLIYAMPTIVIGELTKKDSPLKLTESQASWFGSLHFFIQPLGSVLSGFLQNWLGTKKNLMMINIPQLTAWVVLFYSTSPTHLYISMALLGLSIGFLEAPILTYVGEITQPKLRGIFSSLLGIFYSIGFMIEAFLGATLPWRTMVLCNIVGPLVGLFAMTLLPDSPVWLVTKGRVRDAERAYQWLRGWVSPEEVKVELDTLVCHVRDTQGQQTEYKLVANGKDIPDAEVSHKKTTNHWKVLLEPEVLIAFRIVVIYFTTAPFPGMFGMRPFTIEILDSLNLPYKSHAIVAACGVLALMGAIMMGVLMKFLGKRSLTFLALGTSIICCFGLGGYIQAGLNVPWFPVGLFCLSYFFGAIIMALPWIVLIEILPLRARSIGSGFCAAYAYVVLFAVTKTYYNLASWLNVYGTCYLYGALGLFGLVYLYLDLPETEGVSLQDIERRLSERRTSSRRTTVKNPAC